MERYEEGQRDVAQLTRQTDFVFGLETEYLLVDRRTFEPLWYRDLDFKTLNSALNEIELEEFESLAGLYPNPPHRPQTPFIVEGYHLFDDAGQPREFSRAHLRPARCTR